MWRDGIRVPAVGMTVLPSPAEDELLPCLQQRKAGNCTCAISGARQVPQLCVTVESTCLFLTSSYWRGVMRDSIHLLMHSWGCLQDPIAAHQASAQRSHYPLMPLHWDQISKREPLGANHYPSHSNLP